jgi:arsenical pump membrane protein
MQSPSREASSSQDVLRWIIWTAGVSTATAAAALHADRFGAAAMETVGPFLTLAVVLAVGVVADRAGAFAHIARVLVPDGASARLSIAAVLMFTALVGGLINLDVAVVVAVPIALGVARQKRVRASELAVAVALTANATSFLLPTSNLTNLLVLNRSPMAPSTYLAQSWLAWLLVSTFTVGVLTAIVGRHEVEQPVTVPAQSRGLGVILDLFPMFLAASAIRAFLGTGWLLHGGFLRDVVSGSLLAAAVNNLPAAAAVTAPGATARWAAVLAMAIGPNLLLTGSVATLICRRMARTGHAGFRTGVFTVVGAALLPAQILLAFAGLTLTGAFQ